MNRLVPVLGIGETEAIWSLLLSHITGKTQSSFLLRDELILDEDQQRWLENATTRLEANEPVQYILGNAHFLGLQLKVSRDVLIPRPETEELAHWVLQTDLQAFKAVLDVCTGSGCIALAMRNSGKWKQVAGLDVSLPALGIARQNSRNHKLEVEWIEGDILTTDSLDQDWDVIVSNPPYVLPSEAGEMTKGVLKHEPGLALFTAEPILFYKAISQLAIKHLKPGGALFMELNPMTAADVADFIQDLGFQQVQIRKDMFGKERMLKATKPA